MNQEIQKILERIKEEILDYRRLQKKLINKEPEQKLYLSHTDYQHNMAVLIDALIDALIENEK